MILADIKTFYKGRVGKEDDPKDHASGMLKIIDRLEKAGYFDTVDATLEDQDLRVNIPNYKGYLKVVYWPSYAAWVVQAHRNPCPAGTTSSLITYITIRNENNPSPEIDEFVERMKSQLQVGWK